MARIQPPEYYGTRHIAAEIGQSERTVRYFLRERDPGHVGWWRLTHEEYLQLLEELRASPTKPARRYGNRRRRRTS